jgi:hypothetical protein
MDEREAREVSWDDIVVDREGSIWVHGANGRGWQYFASTGNTRPDLSWDDHIDLPDSYGPFVLLDGPARHLVRFTLGLKAVC